MSSISSIKSKTVLSLLGGAVFALGSQGLLAQAVKAANKAAEPDDPLVEVVVTGIRGSLEDALEFKRAASSIVDHISSEDIGSLPALDLGEALQAIPGVQLNAEGSFRESSINLRGLSGGFTLTTANGFGFATPSLSGSSQGAANPFGAFESSIFRGVTVIKSLTADLPTGSIAGIVDQKLPRALEMKRDRYEINVGTRYEDLSDNFDNEFSFRGRKEIIEGKLAVAGTYAYSDQNFRRDLLNLNRYESANNGTRRIFVGENGETLDQWKAANGFAPEDTMLVATETRQYSELAEGDRYSYALNVAWDPTEKLSFNLDLLGTEKELDAVSDIFIFEIRQNNSSGTYTPTPGVMPIYGFADEDGTDNYVFTDYSFENGQYYPGSRHNNRLEKADGVFFTGDWEEESWKLSFGAAKSEAEAFNFNTQFDARYRAADRRGNQDGPGATNGITGRFFTGNGNLDDYLLTIDGAEYLDLNAANFSYPLRNSDNQPHEILDRLLNNQQSVPSVETADDGTINRVSFFVTGQEQFVNREHEQFNIDFEYQLDDLPIIDSVKVGVYTSKEEYDRNQNRPLPAFINLDGITQDLLIPAVHTQGTDFFDGNLPGHFTAESGWLAVDTNAAIAALTTGIAERYDEVYQDLLAHQTVEEGNTASDALTNAEKAQAVEFYADPQFTADGFLKRREDRFQTEFHSSKVEIDEAYFMANFSGQIGSMPYRGNWGIRYAETTTSGRGLVLADGGSGTRLWDNTFEESTPSHTYSNTLPSFNFSLDVTENITLRTAYYEGISRPNVAAFRPNGSVTENDQRINIRVADTELPPFKADSFDFSINWYNRPGSVVALGYFRKDVLGQSTTEMICPADGGGFGYGTLSIVGTGVTAECLQDELFEVVTVPDDPNTPQNEEVTELINREVNITQPLISDEEQKIEGLELSIQQNLDFLPGFWSNFGGQVSYSRVTNDGDRIPGISEKSYNLVGYYETDRFNARLAYNYRSEYLLSSTSTFFGSADRDAKDRKRLDLSLSYEVIDDLRVTFRAYNLLDDIQQEFMARNEQMGRFARFDGRIYSLAARYQW